MSKIGLNKIKDNCNIVVVLSTRGCSNDHPKNLELIKQLHPNAIDLNDTDLYIESHYRKPHYDCMGGWKSDRYWEVCSRYQGLMVDSSEKSDYIGGFNHSIEKSIENYIYERRNKRVKVKVLKARWDYWNGVLTPDTLAKDNGYTMDV